MSADGNGYVLEQQAPDAPLTGRNIEDFLLCPRKYLLSAFASRARTKERLGGPAALHSAVRSALLELYRALPDTLPGEALVPLFEAAWDASACRDSKEEEDLHRDGVAMLRKHHAAPIAVPPSVSVDARLEAELGGYRFIAVADVLAAGPTTAARFVTSRRPPSEAQLADEPSWRLLYLLAREVSGDERTGAVMVDLRRDRRVTFALGGDGRDQAVGELARVAERIRSERTFDPSKGGHCRWCRSRTDCPAWR